MILLNAVIPSSNLAEFTRWLGHDEANGLSISWKPTRNLEAFFYRAMKEDWRGVLHYFERFQIDNVLPPNQNSSTRQNAIMLTDRYQRYLGPVLIFCSSRKDAEQIASGVMELFSSDTVSNEQLHIAASKIALVLGDSFPLVRMVSRGVAYHHASLPDPVKSLLEDLARKGQLKVLACTSTLAEGVNLNVRTVIISSPFAGGQRIDGARLRNLAGRAGRALKDTEGHVVVMHGDLQQLLQDPESGHVRSRFFEYVEEIQKTPGFNRDIDVIEAELLARVYKKQLSEQRIAAQTQFLLGSTLFSHQANHKQIASANSRMIEQAQTVFKMKPERDERLRVFAATGLSLDFCRKLDEAAARVAQGSDCRFRIGKSVN